MDDTCVVCGAIIPEGRQVCPVCEQKYCGHLEDGQAMAHLLRQSVLERPPNADRIIPYQRKENNRHRSWTEILCGLLYRKQSGQRELAISVDAEAMNK